MDSALVIARTLADAITKERKDAMMEVLRLRHCSTCGVTVHEVIKWLNLPSDRSTQTSIGGLLAEVGYRRYRRTNPITHERERRLFLPEAVPESSEWRENR